MANKRGSCDDRTDRSHRDRTKAGGAVKIKLHHPGIVVPDLEAGIAFYSRFLNLQEQFRFDWDESDRVAIERVIDMSDSSANAVMLKGDGYQIELFEYTAPRSAEIPGDRRASDLGIRHLAFEVDDIDSACEAFTSAGGSFHDTPQLLGNAMCIYGRDPFGNIIELMEFVD